MGATVADMAPSTDPDVKPARDLDDHALAAHIAGAAGSLLLALRADAAAEGLDPDLLRKQGDHRSNQLILDHLAAARPDDPVLSEESADDDRRLGAARVWIVDPLDGTREFAEEGRSDWAVHVALVLEGSELVGAVALPAEDLVLATRPAPALAPPRAGRLRVVTSRTRMPAAATRVAEALDAELVPLGSAGAKAMAVVKGDVDVYAHAGGMYQWDSAAPVAVATAAGLHVSRIDGSPLVYNGPEAWLPDLLVCRPELATACLDALAG
jgi:3'(2'), 5'-bisphosphate nucleotidase